MSSSSQLRLLACVLACCVSVAVLRASIPAYDSFTRADASTLGTDWTNVHGTAGITSNTAAEFGSTLAYTMYSADAFNADQWAQITVAAVATSNSFGPCVRLATTGGGQGYCLIANSVSSNIYKVSGATTFTSLEVIGSAGVGDILKLQIEGTSPATLTAYKNGAAWGTPVTDSTYATGQPGMYLGSAATTHLDDFAADNVAGGGGGGGSAPGGLLLRGVGAALWRGLWPFDGRVPLGVRPPVRALGADDVQLHQHDRHGNHEDRWNRQDPIHRLQLLSHLRSFRPERSDLSRASNIAQVARG